LNASSDQQRRPPGARETVELIALVVTPATLLATLLYYFGWARSRAQVVFFDIDTDVLGRSSNEYALRSIGSIFWPLVLMLLGILAAIALHEGTRRWFSSPRRWPDPGVLGAVLGLAGLVLLAVALVGVFWSSLAGSGPIRTPVTFALGIPIVAYAVLVASSRRASGLKPIPRWPLGVVVGLVVVFLFWAVGNFADARGRKLAERTAANLNGLPTVTVYSPRRLHLEGNGIAETRLAGADSAYRYRYTGLKLLARAASNYFLLPRCLTRS